MEKAKIEIRGLTKVFNDGKREVKALDGLDMRLAEGKINVIVGPSGCGKSTLLQLIAGFEKPTSGEILLDGKRIEGPGPDRGFVFQDYALYPWRTVKGNIRFGLECKGMGKGEADALVDRYVHLVGLDGFEDAYPNTLSGGMKQRVGIARALAYDPDVLLMDEPFAALDAQTRKFMQEELVRIWQKTEKTVVFITHSVIEATFLADRVFVMTSRPGRLKKEVKNPLPYPRDYVSDEYEEKRKEILSVLESEVKKELEQDHLS